MQCSTEIERLWRKYSYRGNDENKFLQTENELTFILGEWIDMQRNIQVYYSSVCLLIFNEFVKLIYCLLILFTKAIIEVI